MVPVTQPPDSLIASRTEFYRFLVPILCRMALSCNVEVVDYKVNAFDCSPFSDIVDLYIINHTTYVKSGVFLYLPLPYLVF